MRSAPCFATAALLAALACSAPEPRDAGGEGVPEAGPLVVYVVNAPLAWLAARIGGDTVEVHFPAPPDVDPAFWSPAPETIVAYQQADLVLLNGAGYARWVQHATLPRGRLVDTSAGFADRLLPVAAALTHSHGPEGGRAHADTAFTTWLDPTLLVEQGRAVADAFADARPEQGAAFRERFEVLADELHTLDERLAAAAERIGAAPLLFSHPVYAYLIRRYGLNARSLHWEPDEMPDAAAWQQLDALLAEHPARWLLWEAPPRAEIERALAERGIRSAVYAPAGAARGEEFPKALERNAAALESLSRLRRGARGRDPA